ncbi:gp398 [Bacillus phage G]|uniref:Gp398 n=1 Tax=Bacillus phage G TaxID=2884420 RepID=G3MAD9_9CAUD|nr:gp398 [Bacillus phage G]AEO93657.1 gp398 [Bacillus phage G]
MRVKIGDKIYDSEKEPIMLILEPYDKECISSMHQDATKYCTFPDGYTEEQVLKFMEEDK